MQKIVASDRAAIDYFGVSVAISGDYSIVGAYQEDEDPSGGNTASRAGSAYIFYNNAGTWTEVQKLVASDREADDQFGWSVAISGDYAIVGAHEEDEDTSGGNTATNAGSAYIFHNNAGTWAEVQKIVASDREADDQFGWSVAISGDYGIVGARWEDHDTSGGNTVTDAGSAYIFKTCSNTYGTDVIIACNSYTWIDGITYTSRNDSATYVLTNLAGCDSVVNLDLSIQNVDTAVNLSNITLTANADSASYQWLDCGNAHSIIPGETGRSFTATANGTYAVEITESGCADTSACFPIINVGLATVPLTELLIYPNPSSGKVSIELPASGEFALKLFDASGKLIFSNPKVKGEYELDLSGYAKGLYRIHLQGDVSQMSEWIVRE